MAIGSEYLFPIPAREGILSVILYFDYMEDEAMYYQGSEIKIFYKKNS
jgi:hypothetical protein